MNGAVDLPLQAADLSFAAAGGTLVRRTVLPDGVRVLTEQVPGARSTSIGYWVAVGSRDESGAEAARDGSAAHAATFGSTHFLEHLLFKGTGRRSALDIAVAFDSVGGEHNALTGKEHTCYYAKVQDRDAPMAIEVLSDMLTSSVLDAAEFENERQVIQEELAMADDDPADVVGERFFQAVLGPHPLGRPIGGDRSTIAAATRDGVLAHYQAAYRPHELVVTAAGALDHERLVGQVRDTLAQSEWRQHAPHAPAARRDTREAAVAKGSELNVTRRPTEQANLIIGMPGLTATDERRYALSVLNSALGGGMSSRLFQEVRERRGLAYSVYSFASGYSDAGVFGLYAGCAPGNAGQVARLMLEQLHAIAENGIDEGELHRAVGQLSGSAALALEDSDARMSRLGRAELTMGEFTDLDETLRRLERVSAQDVQQLAATLAGRPLSLAAVGSVDENALTAAMS